jgi:uncharacterized damage-inducible protein DinB
MSIYDPVRGFRKLAYNNALANYRLHQACRQLQSGEFEAPRVSFFPSIKATLNHILVVDRFYIDALQGGTLGPAAWTDPEPCQSIDALAIQQGALDKVLVMLADDLSADQLSAEVLIHRQDRIQRERFDDVLHHVFQHQTHHRGQIHAMLAGTSVKPPQLDEFIVADDAKFRQEEVAALGLDETMLMQAGSVL